MMEGIVRVAWGLLALVHAPPAIAFFAPKVLRRLYGIAPEGDVGVLMVHRGALFVAVVAGCLLALLSSEARRVASVVVAISVVGFLVTYARAGAPTGLRSIAIADALALAPLAVVAFAAWR